MLFAKVNPTAKVGVQTDPFNVLIKEASYMTAMASTYKLGQSSTRFEVVFGEFREPGPVDEPALPPFNVMYTTSVEFTSEELATWGADDTVALELIAAKLGTDVVEVVNQPEIFAL